MTDPIAQAVAASLHGRARLEYPTPGERALLDAPPEFDARLAHLHYQRAIHRHALDRPYGIVDELRRLAGQRNAGRRPRRGEYVAAPMPAATALRMVENALSAFELPAGAPVAPLYPYELDDARKTAERYLETVAMIERLDEVIAIFNHAFSDRGGWRRYYMVTSSAGHLHANTQCSHRGRTTYGWVTRFSGAAPAAVIAEFGHVACTKCFEGAPVAQAKISRRDALAETGAPDLKG